MFIYAKIDEMTILKIYQVGWKYVRYKNNNIEENVKVVFRDGCVNNFTYWNDFNRNKTMDTFENYIPQLVQDSCQCQCIAF